MSAPSSPSLKHWLHAFRLRTLPLAASSILVGSALAWHGRKAVMQFDAFSWPVLWLALTTAVLLQILSNLANDLGDHEHGTDNADRVGPQRAVQSGAIAPSAMKRAMIICGALAFVSGCALITVALGFTLKTLLFLFLGLLAIGAAVKYTFGSNPYGYAGLGDVSVFLFFGIVGVYGTFFLHSKNLNTLVLLPAIGMGLLSAGVLNLNNMRDIANDAASGKRTLVVRMGLPLARWYHFFLVSGGAASVAWTAHALGSAGDIMAPLILLPDAIRILTKKELNRLDKDLKFLALSTFWVALYFSVRLFLKSYP